MKNGQINEKESPVDLLAEGDIHRFDKTKKKKKKKKPAKGPKVAQKPKEDEPKK
ncbi:MAG: hypothetical protein IIU29_03100 [Erysipelotrichaceae bacterium]|nr:hypothetical protein [Erysipelotrichaceae bacterium]